MQLSSSRIDRLGKRLCLSGSSELATEEDLRLLAGWRAEFQPQYERVLGQVRTVAVGDVAGRPAKTTGAIVAKLKRQSLRLSQMQDVSGCRAIVSGIDQQNHLVRALCRIFPDNRVCDRRQTTSHGYRAVHVVVGSDRLVEIQVRTQLQHVWAEWSDALTTVFGDEVKYGGTIPGQPMLRVQLTTLSGAIAQLEAPSPSQPNIAATLVSGFAFVVVAHILDGYLPTELKFRTRVNDRGPGKVAGIVLVGFDRETRSLQLLESFTSLDRAAALDRRLEVELTHPGLEVNLLEADSLNQLTRTHPRYFGRDALKAVGRSLTDPAGE